jgi:deoxyribonuclease V
MPILSLHPWDLTPAQAVDCQRALAHRVITAGKVDAIRRVAGIDVGFEDDNRVTRAAVAVLDYGDLTLETSAVARRPTTFPYIPGLLSFREIPAVLAALGELTVAPDIVLCDGQGLAHPRRFGIACHLGVLTDLPTIGVAKTRLIGEHEPVPQIKGAWRPLTHKGERIGAVLRTRINTRPLFISLGHRIGLEEAIDVVMHCVTRYRLPETTRAAHRLASGSPDGGFPLH